MRGADVARFVAVSLIWGSTWYAITLQLGSVAPEVSVVYRFALASLVVAAWCVATGASLAFPLREHPILALFGATFFGFNYLCVYLAERYIASGLVAVVFSTIVFMSPVLMRLRYGDPVKPRTLLAAALGVLGVGLLFLPELDAARQGGDVARGIALALGATFLAALGNLVAVRNHRAGVPTLPSTAWGMAYGAMLAAAVAALDGARWTFEATPAYVLSLAYLAIVGSVAAFALYLTLLRNVGVWRTSFVSIATPVIALGVSTLLEGYRWTWAGVAGVLLAIVGNVIAIRAKADATRS